MKLHRRNPPQADLPSPTTSVLRRRPQRFDTAACHAELMTIVEHHVAAMSPPNEA
jgi:hypothetical protein